ncbi:MAG: hypothetical protein AAFP69_03775 [Planctomycetota bacterium]
MIFTTANPVGPHVDTLDTLDQVTSRTTDYAAVTGMLQLDFYCDAVDPDRMKPTSGCVGT